MKKEMTAKYVIFIFFFNLLLNCIHSGIEYNFGIFVIILLYCSVKFNFPLGFWSIKKKLFSTLLFGVGGIANFDKSV